MSRRITFFIVSTLCFMLIAQAYGQDLLVMEGHVTQGTEGGPPIPENLPVQLAVVDSEGRDTNEFTVVTGSDGDFRFEGVPPYPNGGYYRLSTAWAGITQTSLPLNAEQIGAPVTFYVYELTDSVGTVVAHKGNLSVEFAPTRDLGIQMVLELNYINLGDRIVLSDIGTGRAGSFTIELPVGAFGISPEVAPGDVQRFQPVQSAGEIPIPGIRDTQPLVPNWPNAMRASFFVPYQSGAVIDMRLPFAASGFGIFVSKGLLTLESDLFEQVEDQTISSGKTFSVFEQRVPVNASEPFKFVLSGERPRPAGSGLSDSSLGGTRTIMLIAFIAGALLILTGVVLWLLRNRPPTGDTS